jgi:hypothetical protein
MLLADSVGDMKRKQRCMHVRRIEIEIEKIEIEIDIEEVERM